MQTNFSVQEGENLNVKGYFSGRLGLLYPFAVYLVVHFSQD